MVATKQTLCQPSILKRLLRPSSPNTLRSAAGSRDRHAEADNVPALRGLLRAAIGRTAVPGIVEPGAAAKHAEFPISRPLRINSRTAPVVLRIGPVRAPLGDVAVHIA